MGLFSGGSSATVVFDNFRGLSNVPTNLTPANSPPNYQNYQPTSDPNKSVDQLQNLINLAAGGVGNSASSGTDTNIDWNQASNTLCNTTTTAGTNAASCTAYLQGRVTYALIKFPVTGTYTFSVAHDDETKIGFASQFTAANAANYRNFNYNVPVGSLTSYTATDTTFQQVPGDFQITQANTCYVMQVYWNNQQGVNDLRLQWTVPGQAAAIIPGSALFDPSVAANYSTCASSAQDFGIAKTAPATFVPGTPIRYTITVWNYSGGDATAAHFSDTLPASLSNITFTCVASGSAACGSSTNSGNAYAITTGALPVNSSTGNANTPPTTGSFLTYTVTATPSDVATIVNTATITDNDTNSANNTGTTTSTAASHNNTLTKVWSGATAGDTVSLNITGTGVSNATAGSSTAPATTTAATAAANINTSINLVEAFTTGTAAKYATTLACVKNTDGTAVTVTGTGLSRSITEPADSGVKCTYTNTLAANVAVSKSGPATATTGSSYSYTLVVTNNGGAATGTNVIVRDQLPAGEVATASTNATCTPLNSAAALLTCTIPGPIAAAASVSVGLTVTAPTAAGAITNYAATSPTGTGNPVSPPSATCNTATTSCSSAATTVQAPVLTLTKTHAGNFTVGVNGVYTLTLSNSSAAGTGPTAGTVTVSDTLPSGLTYVSAAGTGWTCNAAGQVVTCTSTTAIAAGASAPAITLTVGVAASATPSVTNSANVSGGGDSTCPATARCAPTDPTTVNTAANVSVSKTGPATALTGSSYAYTLAVVNSGGTATGTGVIVQDQLPAGEVATASTNATCAPLNSVSALLTCTLTNAIAANATISVTLTVTAPAIAGAITNYAATNPAGSGSPPSVPGAACNTTTTSCSSAPTTVNTAANVSVTKTGPATALTGSSYAYTLAVANSGGTATGTGVIVQDQLPGGEVATASTNATCAPLNSAGALLTCTLTNAIAANATTSVGLTVTAPATAGAIINYAATNPAGSGNPPSVPGVACNTTTTSCSGAPTAVNTAANVSVSKTGPATALTGSSYAYTLAVTNNGGTATGTGVIVQDQLPAGEVATASTNATCAPLNSAGALLTCTLTNAIAANATTSVGLTVTAPATSGAIANYAATNPAGSGNPPSAPGVACNTTTTSCSSAPTTVNSAANVSVTKTGPATAVTGSSYAYTLAVVNNGGTATGTGVIVQDQLPAGEVATASTNATCTPFNSAGALLTCTLTNAIAANATTSVGLTVTAPATSGAITNYAATNPAGSGNPPSAPGVACNTTTTSCSSAPTTVNTTANVAVTKTGPAAAIAGSSYTYTLAVANNGGTATGAGVIVQDQLPAGEVATASTNATCAPLNSAGALLTCTLANAIAANATTSVILTVIAPATAGAITNYAATNPAGSGSPPSQPGPGCNTTTTNCSSAATTVNTAANISVTKTGPATAVAGSSYAYTLAVANGGGTATGTGVIVQDQLPAGEVATASTNATCTPLNSAGALLTCTLANTIAANATTAVGLTVTAPSTSGAITNYAATNPTGSGNPPSAPGASCNTTTTSCSGAPTTVNTAANVSVSKTGPATALAGSSYAYTLAVANSGGTTTGAGVIVQDQLPAGEVATAATNATCAPLNNAGALLTCTLANAIAANATTAVSLTVTAPAAAGAITNYAATNPTGGGNPPSAPGASCNTATTSCSSAPTTVNTAANVSVSKTGPATASAGSSYAYTLAVANSGGTATGTGVIVQDQLPAGEVATASTNATCTPLNSAGALLTCTLANAIAANATTSVGLTVTAPATSGAITNYAATNPAGSGNPPTAPGAACNAATTSCSNAATTVQVPVLNLAKTHAGNFTVGVNGVYTLTASNSGGAPTTGTVTVSDTLPTGLGYISATGTGWTCGATGQVLTCTSTAAIAAGASAPAITLTVSVAAAAVPSVTNTATASGGGDSTCPAAAHCVASDPTAVGGTASLTLKKTATVADTNGDSVVGDAGDVITYAFAVTNTGNVPLTNVKVTDPLLPGLSCTIATLSTGATTSCAATGNAYTITAADVSAGHVNNTATATGTPPGNITPPTGSSSVSTPTAATPTASLTLKKTATVADTNGDGVIGDAGDVITYAFAVSNTGTVALTSVKVTDPLLPGLSCTIANLAVSATTSCAATGDTYTITTADVSAGHVNNTASATATPPGNLTPPTGSSSVSTPTAVTPVAGMTLKKTATVADTNGDLVLGDAGDTITYAFAVTNTGTVALTNVKVTDVLLPNLGCTVPTLAAGATTACAATGNSYTITANDAASGHVDNTADATGTPPVGSNIKSPTATGTATAQTAATPTASLTFQKAATVADTNADAVLGDAGDTITYSFSATNTGTTELTDVTVSDPRLPNLVCSVGILQAGASGSCAATNNTYVITAADATAGKVDNTATVTGRPPGNLAPPTASATVSTPTKAGTSVVTLSKQAAQRDVNIGDLVRYTVVATAAGNVAARDVTLIDTPPAGFSYVQGSLSVVDADKSGTLAGSSPIRVTGINIPAGGYATITYFLRVGAGVGTGVHTNQAVVDDASGKTLSNVASAEVELTSDPLLDDSLIIGTVFDDRDGDGWQDPARASKVRVQGGFAADVYMANSTTVDRGHGPQPEADHSAPLLHGLSLGTVSGRSSTVDTAARHQVIVSQRLREPRFTDDFVLTTGEGTTLRMDAAGQTTIERRGDARKGLTGQDISVERRVGQTDGGYQVDYIIRDNGIEERGIPGVRVVSVEGLVMETDAYGRFNLQGIDGGEWARGRNFILKVDPSTLPPGSVFTTENPRVIRITPGVPVRFDFGVKLPPGEIEGGHAEADIALGEVLFTAGSAEVNPSYASALDSMAGKIRQYGGGSLTIAATAAQPDLAFARARAVQTALDKRLDVATRGRLRVNVTVAGDPSPLVSLGQGVHLGTLLFDTDKASIRPAYRSLLRSIAGLLDDQGGGVVTLVGRADHRGADAYNTQLGLRRARAVYDAIVADLEPEVRAKVRVEISDNPNAPLGVDAR